MYSLLVPPNKMQVTVGVLPDIHFDSCGVERVKSSSQEAILELQANTSQL